MSDAFAILTVLAYYGKADDMEGLLHDLRLIQDAGQTINEWAEELLTANKNKKHHT